jgi:hypothetical protein
MGAEGLPRQRKHISPHVLGRFQRTNSYPRPLGRKRLLSPMRSRMCDHNREDIIHWFEQMSVSGGACGVSRTRGLAPKARVRAPERPDAEPICLFSRCRLQSYVYTLQYCGEYTQPTSHAFALHADGITSKRRAVGLCFVLWLRVVVQSFVVLLFRNVYSSLVLLVSIRLGSLLEASYISGLKIISGGERAGKPVPGCTLWRDNVFES